MEGERIRFSSAILPRWARRTKSLDALLPALYLRGVSAGDFQEALAALLGKEAANLSPSVISRLKGEWEGDYERWRKRDLSARHYVYLWADGVYLQARMEPQAECMLVLIGATPEGRKELVGFQAGYRESAQSWKELLVDLKVEKFLPAHKARYAMGLGTPAQMLNSSPAAWTCSTACCPRAWPATVRPTPKGASASRAAVTSWISGRSRKGAHATPAGISPAPICGIYST